MACEQCGGGHTDTAASADLVAAELGQVQPQLVVDQLAARRAALAARQHERQRWLWVLVAALAVVAVYEAVS